MRTKTEGYAEIQRILDMDIALKRKLRVDNILNTMKHGGFDAAFLAVGAHVALIVYRRTREQMPAHDFELHEALDEGIMVKWLNTITRIEDAPAFNAMVTMAAAMESHA